MREYVQKIRIEKSCELLEDSDLRVVEIARRVGYEDIKFFNQIFKRRMQVSPVSYTHLDVYKRQVLGGALTIEWDEKTNHIFMTGPAEFVFDGELEYEG